MLNAEVGDEGATGMRRLPAEAIRRAIEILRSGGIVAYPTDTLYGLAVDPRSADGVRRVFEVKGREAGHAVPLIAADVEQAAEAALFDARARRAAAAFWPGPLSIVLPARDMVRRELLGPDDTIAVRVADHPVALALAKGLWFCITATSANLTGHPPTSSPELVERNIGKRIDLILDDGPSPGGAPSTIIDLRGPAPRLVREGAIAWERVLRSIQ